ncbi:uncharacterized protein LAJ45_02316 [Morchella importuna]|uniref:uncharacterized protein n=1 Tax=Morchella importuna TaxID=1174673 RepID=UPI001E8E817A|nr:uncharacterized protein LAJ45_02316 [Morchella importuna]KAH8153503.1 hypothetical protein LAJ45_02316 [Morchella importuna]
MNGERGKERKPLQKANPARCISSVTLADWKKAQRTQPAYYMMSKSGELPTALRQLPVSTRSNNGTPQPQFEYRGGTVAGKGQSFDNWKQQPFRDTSPFYLLGANVNKSQIDDDSGLLGHQVTFVRIG